MRTNQNFRDLGAKEFLRRYPVRIVGDPGVGIKGDPLDGQGSVVKGHRAQHIDFHRSIDPRMPITGPRNYYPVSIGVGADVGPFRAYYLPYADNSNYRITLKTAEPGSPNVDFFLTALVDGCSIYVEGTQQTPTVYHINAVGIAGLTEGPKSLVNLAAEKGRDLGPMTFAEKHRFKFGLKSEHMDDRYMNNGKLPKTLKAGVDLVQSRKLENDNYMLRPGSGKEERFNQTLRDLQRSNHVPRQVGPKSVDAMKCVATQGFVFGVRTGGAGGTWKFYVQRKAVVELFHRSRKEVNRENPDQSLGYQWIVRDVVQFWPNPKC